MKRLTLTNNQDSKDADEERKTQISTINAYHHMLKNLKVNENVINANIHELFLFFKMAFFSNQLDVVILEWSEKMTLCAGICYYEVLIPVWFICLEWTLYNKVKQIPS